MEDNRIAGNPAQAELRSNIRSPRVAVSRPDEFKNAKWAMIHGWTGVVFSQAVFGAAVFLVSMIPAIVSTGFSDPIALFALVFVLILGMVGLFLAGGLLGAFWSTIVIAVIGGLDYSLGESISPRMAVRFFGATTGLLATCWISLGILSYNPNGVVLAFFSILIFGAMAFGQVSGLWWAAYHDAWRLPKRQVETGIDDEDTIRFGIRHILLLMIVCSVVFTGDAVFADRFGLHAPMVIFGVYVFGMLVLVGSDQTMTRWGREARAEKRLRKKERAEKLRQAEEKAQSDSESDRIATASESN